MTRLCHDQRESARRRQRGRPAAHGDAAPARPRAEAADPAQQRQAALRRHPVGRPGPGRARRVRPGAARPRRRGALPRRPARRDPRRRRRPARARDRRRSWRTCTSGDTLRALPGRGARASCARSELAHSLCEGVRNDEVRGGSGWSPAFMADDDFVIDPLPNLLFTRDSSVWIRDHVAVTTLAMPARERETQLTELIYTPPPALRRHPRHPRLAPGVRRGRRRAAARPGRGGGRRRRAHDAGRRRAAGPADVRAAAWPRPCSPCRSPRSGPRCTSTPSARWSTSTRS